MITTVKKIISSVTYDRSKFIKDTLWNQTRDLLLAEFKIDDHWECYYTGEVILSDKRIDIDHIIPLKYAWTNGANKWTPTKRNLFSIDSDNLNVTALKENRRKGDSNLSKYIPHIHSYEYIESWRVLCKKYDLIIPDVDNVIIQNNKKSN